MSTPAVGMVSSRSPMRMSMRLWCTPTRITPIFTTDTAMAEIRGAAGKEAVAESLTGISGTCLPDGGCKA